MHHRQLLEIMGTFMTTGFENSKPTTTEMRGKGEQKEREEKSKLNLSLEERKLVKQSMFRCDVLRTFLLWEMDRAMSMEARGKD